MISFMKSGIKINMSINPTIRQITRELRNIGRKCRGAPCDVAILYAKNTMQKVMTGV